ncbi:MAG TPA: DUF2169 domain-containing protein, partial [Sorangium sp.]|nr:DUF2169 domain-containing protein [Sorangium sp.]
IVAQCDPARLARAAYPAADAPTRGWPVALPVGLVPWEQQQARTTVVVKVSYRYERSSLRPALQLLAQQPGFTVAQASTLLGAQPPEVGAPTDLVAAKALADVAVVGSAYAAGPAKQMEAAFSLGQQFTRRVRLAHASERAAIPLTLAHLLPHDGEPASPLGPIAVREVAAAELQRDGYGLTDEEKIAQHEALLQALRNGEWKPWETLGVVVSRHEPEPPPAEADPTTTLDTTTATLTWNDLSRTTSLLEPAVQCSPPCMTCPFIPPDAEVKLRGLTPGGDEVVVPLPGHEVLVVVEGAGHYDVTMAVDTLLWDTDAAVVSLTWRGQVPEDLLARSDTRLLVALVPLAHAFELEDLYRQLPRGHFGRAELPAQLETLQSRGEDVQLACARQMTFHYAPDPLLSRDDYAALAARLAARPQQREQILSEVDFDEREWRSEERAWQAYLGRALQRGDLAAVQAHNELLTAARLAASTSAAPPPSQAATSDGGRA